MKLFRNRRYIFFSALALIVVISWASYGIINTHKEEERCNISVIVSNSNLNRWTAFKEGIEQAAADDNVRINFVSGDLINSVYEQKTLIDRELASGADAIILEPYSSQGMSELLSDISSQAAVVLLDTDVTPEGIYTVVKADNLAIGKAIGQAVISDFGKDLAGRKIGVLSGNQSRNSMKERLEGFKSSFGEGEGKIEWILEDSADLPAQLSKAQAEDYADIIVSLGNDETEAAVDYIQSAGNEGQPVVLYGEGRSEKLVYYLDKGTIRVLIVPNEFNMGYLSLVSAEKLLKYKNATEASSQIEFLVINKDNMYDEDNQKILFPIVQ